ncbi:MAG: kynureninase, partial [Flavobacteriaceae bacterium]|nr:kynureninase [Flavobacteriaceae bacterium]
MVIKEYEINLDFARQMDAQDPLRDYRTKYHIPKQSNGEPFVYLCGNSLGLQPKATKQNVEQELLDWQNLGVEGHLHAKNPWLPYHEFLTEAMARVVGAKPAEIVVMNTLTVNLHLMMVSFYRPKGKRNKILIEADAFPSDRYAAQSQIRFHGLSPDACLIELKAQEGEVCLREEDILEAIDSQGDEIALILLGNTNYYTGQYFDMQKI